MGNGTRHEETNDSGKSGCAFVRVFQRHSPPVSRRPYSEFSGFSGLIQTSFSVYNIVACSVLRTLYPYLLCRYQQLAVWPNAEGCPGTMEIGGKLPIERCTFRCHAAGLREGGFSLFGPLSPPVSSHFSFDWPESSSAFRPLHHLNTYSMG